MLETPLFPGWSLPGGDLWPCFPPQITATFIHAKARTSHHPPLRFLSVLLPMKHTFPVFQSACLPAAQESGSNPAGRMIKNTEAGRIITHFTASKIPSPTPSSAPFPVTPFLPLLPCSNPPPTHTHRNDVCVCVCVFFHDIIQMQRVIPLRYCSAAEHEEFKQNSRRCSLD